MSKRKYIYWHIVQANYGYGWEDLEQVNQHWDDSLCAPMDAPKSMYIRKLEGYPKVGNTYYTEPIGYARYLLGEHRLAYPSAQYRIINRRELNVNTCKGAI